MTKFEYAHADEKIGRMSVTPNSRAWQGNSSCVQLYPASLAKHPHRWSKEEVGVWLKWCSEEFAIEEISQSMFNMNGKAVCLLSRHDFMERLPQTGDVIYNCLQSLAAKAVGGGAVSQSMQLMQSIMPGMGVAYADRTTPAMLTGNSFLLDLPVVSPSMSPTSYPSNISDPHVQDRPPYVPIQPRPPQTPTGTSCTSSSTMTFVSAMSTDPKSEISKTHSITSAYVPYSPAEREMNSESPGSVTDIALETEDIPSDLGPKERRHELSSELDPFMIHSIIRRRGSTECRLLWEFIYALLQNSDFSHCVCWESQEEYVFRILNPTELAELWGQQKNRTNMTYEKLSRALRYYYRMNILKKVPGKRLTYKFLQPPSCIQKGQRGARPHSKLQASENVTSSHSVANSDNNNLSNNNSSYNNSNHNSSCSSNSSNSTAANIAAYRADDDIFVLDYKRQVEVKREMSPSGVCKDVPRETHTLSTVPSAFSHSHIPIPIVKHNVPQVHLMNGNPESVPHGRLNETFYSSSGLTHPIHVTKFETPVTAGHRGDERSNSCPSRRLSQEMLDSRLFSIGQAHFSPTIPNAHTSHRKSEVQCATDSHTRSDDVKHILSIPHDRPWQTRSASPRIGGGQIEPVDLSVRKIVT